MASTGKREREVAQAFQPLQQATQELLASYKADELELITHFLASPEAVMAQLATAQRKPHE